MLPKGFGKGYFTLAAIQAYVSQLKIIAVSTSVSTLSGKPLTIKIANTICIPIGDDGNERKIKENNVKKTNTTIYNINRSFEPRTSVDKKDLTDSMTIITKEQIKEARITNLADALNRLGGIAMTQNGGPGKATSMFVRGMDTKRLLVLIDGVRYNNPTAIGAAANFSQIMLYNVKQIEIIKGAQSGVWGSDASGGVINIITSTAKKGLHGSTNVEYGSFNTKIASLTASYAEDDFDILIGGSIFDNGGYSATEPKKGNPNYGKRYDELNLEKDPYKNKTLNAKLGYNFTKKDRLEANIQTINSTIKFDAGAGIDSSIPQTILTNRFYNLAYKHSDDTQKINLLYNLSTFNRDVTLTYGEFTYKGSVNEIKLNDKITYAKDSFVKIGASYQKYEQKKITANTNKSYSAISAFASNYNKFGKDTILTESIRYDKYDKFNDALTGKIGAKQMHRHLDNFMVNGEQIQT